MSEPDITNFDLKVKGTNLFIKLQCEDLETWIPVELSEELHRIDVSNIVVGLRNMADLLNKRLNHVDPLTSIKNLNDWNEIKERGRADNLQKSIEEQWKEEERLRERIKELEQELKISEEGLADYKKEYDYK